MNLKERATVSQKSKNETRKQIRGRMKTEAGLNQRRGSAVLDAVP